MSKSPIVPGKPGIGGGAPIYPVYPPGGFPSGPLLVSVADATVVGESFSSLLSLRINLTEAVSVTDSPTVFRTPLFLSASDTATVSEATALLLITPGTINLLDLVTVTDAATVFITILKVAAADSTTVSESLSLLLFPTLTIALADSITLTDDIVLRVAAPDLPPGPVITTEPGAILCICPGPIVATTVECFAFAATTVGACKLAAVHIEIVLPNLNGNCSGPVFQNPMPPIVGAPGQYAIRIDEAITMTETVSAQSAVTPIACMVVTPSDPQDADDFDRANGNGFNSGNWDAFIRSDGGLTLGRPAYNIVSNQLQVFQDNVGAIHDVVQGGWLIASDTGLTTQFAEVVYNGSEVLTDPGTHVSQPMTLNMGGPCVRMNQNGVGNEWVTNITCYVLNIQESRNRTTPYAITQHVLEISHIGTLGVTSLTQIALTGANVLVPGDVVRLTAMNFASDGITIDRVCLRAYVNGVQKLTTTRILSSATGILAGRVGLGTDGFDGSSDASIPGFWKGYLNNWAGGAGTF